MSAPDSGHKRRPTLPPTQEFTVAPNKYRSCVVCRGPIQHGEPFATCSMDCGRKAREHDLDRALDEQRKRLDALYVAHINHAPEREVRKVIEDCMHANARMQDMARKL